MIEAMVRWLGMPAQAAEHAAEVDRMSAIVHWLMLMLFVGWAIYFVWVLLRFRAGRNPQANYAGVRSHFSQYVEISVAVVEAVLLIAFAIPAWAKRVNEFPQDQAATVVRVVAEQFAWNVHYPGADGQFGRTDVKLVAADNQVGLDKTDPAAKDDVVTINQLNFPVDKPVVVRLSSKDVIHSFAIMQMRVKQDAIPGMEIPVWFQPIATGDWEINCSQLCGLGHYRMRGFVSSQTPEDFRKWLAEQAAEAAATD